MDIEPYANYVNEEEENKDTNTYQSHYNFNHDQANSHDKSNNQNYKKHQTNESMQNDENNFEKEFYKDFNNIFSSQRVRSKDQDILVKFKLTRS